MYIKFPFVDPRCIQLFSSLCYILFWRSSHKSHIFEVLTNKVYHVRRKPVFAVTLDRGDCNRKSDRKLFLDNILLFSFAINKNIQGRRTTFNLRKIKKKLKGLHVPQQRTCSDNRSQEYCEKMHDLTYTAVTLFSIKQLQCKL